jgi:hypothetical protein
LSAPCSLPFAGLEFLPESLGFLDVCLLPLLHSSGKQNDELFSIPPKVDSKARTEIDSHFLNAGPDALYGREIASLQAFECHSHSGLRYIVQLVQPSPERIAAQPVNVLPDFDHAKMVAQKILQK